MEVNCAEFSRDHLRVIAVRNKADILAVRLLGDELESELVRDGTRFKLGLPADRQEHARKR